jgi:low temperature requirement protein LtrA
LRIRQYSLPGKSLVHRAKLHIPSHGHSRRVGWTELFYDLIYVATLIQLGNCLSKDIS